MGSDEAKIEKKRLKAEQKARKKALKAEEKEEEAPMPEKQQAEPDKLSNIKPAVSEPSKPIEPAHTPQPAQTPQTVQAQPAKPPAQTPRKRKPQPKIIVQMPKVPWYKDPRWISAIIGAVSLSLAMISIFTDWLEF